MRARRRSQAALVAVLALPVLPHGRPKTLQIGLTESPGRHAPAHLGFRYQYLAGGVNTGNGWSTWNPNGTIASLYVQDSWAHNEIPVLSYYVLLQSSPSLGGEAATDLGRLRRSAVDGEVPAGRDADVPAHRRQEDRRRARGAGRVGLPRADNHMSGWGTKHDIAYEDPPDATVRAYAQTWFTPADFHRHLLYGATFGQATKLRMVAWQIPLGNTFLHEFGGGADGPTSSSTDWGYFLKRMRAYNPTPVRLP